MAGRILTFFVSEFQTLHLPLSPASGRQLGSQKLGFLAGAWIAYLRRGDWLGAFAFDLPHSSVTIGKYTSFGNLMQLAAGFNG